MDKPVSTLMTTPVRTAGSDDTIEAVAEELRRHHLSCVPIVDRRSNSVLGIISATDILQFQAAKRDPKSVHAWEICTYKPVEFAPDDPISEVARQMVARHIHHAIVVENQELKGVVSSLDFVRQFIL